MPSRNSFEKFPTFKPVSRAQVDDFRKRSAKISTSIVDQAREGNIDWDGWRALRHPDYVIQWGLNQTRFRITRDEYIERWKWTIASGRGWEHVDSAFHYIDTGFISEAILRSAHTDERGERVILSLLETYHLQDGLAIFSTEYIDPTDVRKIDAPIPGGWW